MITPSKLFGCVMVEDSIEWQTETKDTESTTHTVVEGPECQDELDKLA
jgi:hypothetical protein